jgi:hypothetical protein
MPSPSAKRSTSPKKVVKRGIPPRFMETVLEFFFAIVEPDIVKVHPTYISPTVEEFVYLMKRLDIAFGGPARPKSTAVSNMRQKNSKRQTRKTVRAALPSRATAMPFQSTRGNILVQSGGVEISENMKTLFGFMVSAAVGSFDTPCELLFSTAAIMQYAMWAYTIYSARLKEPLPGAEAAGLMSDPADAITNVVINALTKWVPSISVTARQFVPHLREYNTKVAEEYESAKSSYFSRLGSQVTAFALKKVVNMQVYKNMVVLPISCILASMGYESCRSICARIAPEALQSFLAILSNSAAKV